MKLRIRFLIEFWSSERKQPKNYDTHMQVNTSRNNFCIITLELLSVKIYPTTSAVSNFGTSNLLNFQVTVTSYFFLKK